MKLIIIDGEKQTTPIDIYEHFSRELGFGPYFGRNADALYDFMTPVDTDHQPLIVIWKNSSVFKNDYPNEFLMLVSTFNHVDKFSDFNSDVFRFNLL